MIAISVAYEIELAGDEALIKRVRPENPLQRSIQRSDIVIARNDEARERQPIEEVASTAKLPFVGPLRQITRDDQEMRSKVCEARVELVGHAGGLGTEMKVGEMGDTTHALSVCGRERLGLHFAKATCQ